MLERLPFLASAPGLPHPALLRAWERASGTAPTIPEESIAWWWALVPFAFMALLILVMGGLSAWTSGLRDSQVVARRSPWAILAVWTLPLRTLVIVTMLPIWKFLGLTVVPHIAVSVACGVLLQWMELPHATPTLVIFSLLFGGLAHGLRHH